MNTTFKIKAEIAKAITGKEENIELLMISLLFNGHVLLESVPGTGKTMLAKSFAAVIDGAFSRIQFTPDVLPSDVTGIQFFNPKNQEFELRPGPIVANIVLADEINRATPRTQSSLLEVMEEAQVTIDGHTLVIDQPFMVIATQNPVESQQGTFPLPAAQLDRFFIKIKLDYPSLEEEKRMIQLHKNQLKVDKLEKVVELEEIHTMKEEVASISVSEDVEQYILGIVRETRNHPDIELGVSPRGTLALIRAAQGKAYLAGRNYVVPEDVKSMVPFVLTHRIYLSTEASLTKSAERVLQELLHSVPVPVESGLL
ncbi:MoxR-like ATPase [Cytobacillus horneckiae]|uniref:MoxR family ATPase n=1 Tax=Cytobacillus horneckiae TaxID=549687 RepID=A0A2N0Z8X9_9BACI|nr:MoxR family ATPase [Cytobacillus horneckiae]MBN6889241.1 MoxR family ATPase [Cytobacillus horneckiae]MCM3178461.1 MoxR family ATPase [Cytobacillus horneckiae]MEC1156801.1 MoxR family ATPase [Cytobacillus horneckiae]MED2940561.1 MoxR family ATPase [Cytobacillus horneckiae]PKG25957.1 MoxR family ATPase [Cytobacillus horneckiae]